MSVQHLGSSSGTADSLVNLTLGFSPTGSWTIGMWMQFAHASWVDGKEDVTLNISSPNMGGAHGMIVDLETELNVLIFGPAGPGYDLFTLSAVEDNDWWFVAYDHVGGTTQYTVRYRREGETTFGSHVLDIGLELNLFDQLHIGTSTSPSGNDYVTDGLSRGFFAQATAMNDATLLTASQAAALGTAPAGTNVHWLPLSGATGAGTNGGTGTNWTVTGTLLDSADNPTDSSGVTSAIAADVSADFVVSSALFSLSAAVPSASTLRAQQRAKGFPPRAPLPGIVTLGRGTLVAPTVKYSTLAASIANDFTVAATINRAQLPSAAFAQPAPMALGLSTGAPARLVAPPRTLLGTGLLVSGAATLTAVTGTLAASITNDFVVTAVAAETIPGALAVSIADDFVVAGALAESYPATLAADITSDFVVAGALSTALGADLATAIDITADFVPAVALSEAIPATLASDITGDFTVALVSVAANGATFTGAVEIGADFAVAGALTESIPGAIAAAIENDFVVAGSGVAANPVSGAIASDITADFSAGSALTEAIPATLAVSIAGDFVVAGSVASADAVTSTLAASIAADFSATGSLAHTTNGDTVIQIAITNDFVVAALAVETIPSTVSFDIAGDFTVAAVVLLAVTVTGSAAIANDFAAAGSLVEELPSLVAAVITDDFVAAASLTATNNVAASVAVDITTDFVVTGNLAAAVNVGAVTAVDITTDFVAGLIAQVGALFVPVSKTGRKIRAANYDPRRRKV